MEIKYPAKFMFLEKGLIVRFTSLTVGTVIDVGWSNNTLGDSGDYWIPHTDKRWQLMEPVASKKHQLMARIKDFR